MSMVFWIYIYIYLYVFLFFGWGEGRATLLETDTNIPDDFPRRDFWVDDFPSDPCSGAMFVSFCGGVGR